MRRSKVFWGWMGWAALGAALFGVGKGILPHFLMLAGMGMWVALGWRIWRRRGPWER